MFKTCMTLSALAVVGATPVFAQELGGVTISGEFRQYQEDNFDESASSLEVGGDFLLSPQFAIGGNAELGQNPFFNSIGEPQSNFSATGRGMYFISPGTALGAFVSTDSSEEWSSINYGIEAGSRSKTGRFETYFGFAEAEFDGDAFEDTRLFGLSFEFNLAPQIALGLEYDSFTMENGVTFVGGDTEDLTWSDTSLIGRVNVTPEASIYVETGLLQASYTSGGETFVFEDDYGYFGVGAEYSFGKNGGSLMSNRSFTAFGG